MYQNYMDYTDDACYGMFTLKQVERMEWVIENCRSGYLTSNGAVPPVGAITLDISPAAVVNPGGNELIGCNNVNYPPLSCAGNVQPKLRVVNNGLDPITDFTAGLLINGVPQPEQSFNGTLLVGESSVVTFPAFNFVNGSYTLKFYTKNPNGLADQVITNDTLTVTAPVGIPSVGPITESFESTTFPPNGWTVIDGNPGSITWQRTVVGASAGTAAAFMNFFNYTGASGHIDALISPLLDVAGVDSILVSFDRAYRPRSTAATTADSLLIQLSTDCGITFPTTAWRRGGVTLATNTTPLTTAYVPAAADWRNEEVNVKPFIGVADKINIVFVGKNSIGQNLYLDKINIRTVVLFNRNAAANRIVEPFNRLCSRNFIPSVEIANRGKDTIKTLKISYSINGGIPVTVNYAGAPLLKDQVAVVSFPSVNIATGDTASIVFYTSEPNGSADQAAVNDTIRSTLAIFDAVKMPLKEGFENTQFPPANWLVNRSNSTYSWERSNRASSEGVASSWIRNRRLSIGGAIDELSTPLIELSNPDSVLLTFDRAHVTSRYPGSTGVRLDTLELLLTRDCGKTYTSVMKKWGEELQSVGDPNFPYVYPATDTIGFVPSAIAQWKTDKTDLSKALSGVTGTFQLVFRNISNNGNNTFLDNINIQALSLPLALKRDGFLISPNPSEGLVQIRHYVAPVNLKGVQVINAAGQIVAGEQYNGGATSLITLNLIGKAVGLYTIKMIYTNKVITRVITKMK
jgi:hypothetical protein